MGDFVGGTLKYLRRHRVPRLTLAGGFGKFAKLAQGHLDLHSSKSEVDRAALLRLLAELGAPPAMLETAATAASAAAILAAAFELGPALAHRVALAAREVALATLAGGMAVDVAIFDRRGTLLGHAAG